MSKWPKIWALTFLRLKGSCSAKGCQGCSWAPTHQGRCKRASGEHNWNVRVERRALVSAVVLVMGTAWGRTAEERAVGTILTLVPRPKIIKIDVNAFVVFLPPPGNLPEGR